MIDTVPTDLDWVTARAECSLYKMFIELRNGVKDDTKKRNDARKQGEQVMFEYGGESGKGFSVFHTGPKGTNCIDFSLSDSEITVADASNVLFTATITLNDEGRCKFMVGGKELEQWKVRRLALEKFFFRG